MNTITCLVQTSHCVKTLVAKGIVAIDSEEQYRIKRVSG